MSERDTSVINKGETRARRDVGSKVIERESLSRAVHRDLRCLCLRLLRTRCNTRRPRGGSATSCLTEMAPEFYNNIF
jgi:hypothetical protein